MPYDAYAASPVHRLFQMWQDLDCSTKNVTAKNPSGCLNDLFAWVESTVGAGSNGAAQPSGWIGRRLDCAAVFQRSGRATRPI